MRRVLNHQRLRPETANALFRDPTPPDVIGHLSAHFPFPAALTSSYVEKLKAMGVGTLVAQNTVLFEQGQDPTGVHVILEGSTKLAVSSSQGKTLVLGIFGPGVVLGLAAAILGRPHAASAETLKQAKVLFVPRTELVKEMRADSGAACRAAELVSQACYFLLGKMAAIELSQSSEQKLARCLLGLVSSNSGCMEGVTVKLDLNQEAIAQLIGTSRETVSRLLSRFRHMRILDWKYSGLVIRDRRALERIANLEDDSGGYSDFEQREMLMTARDFRSVTQGRRRLNRQDSLKDPAIE